MTEQLARIWRWARGRWQELGRPQRLFAIGLAVAVLGAVGAGLAFGRTGYVALGTGLSPADTAAVVEKLRELGVPYRASDDGSSILVPTNQRLTAGLALAQTGVGGSGSVGLELFAEPRFGATEFDRRVNYLRAQQGELERAILRMAKVEYANVKLALPEPSPFVRDEKPVTAAVLVQTRVGETLSRQEVDGLVNFLSRAVQGLQPENVTVVDHRGRTLTGGPEDAGAAELALALVNEHEQRREALQQEMQLRVEQLLEPVFGPGNVVARVNLTLDLAESRIESRTVSPGAPVSVQSLRETGTQAGSEATAEGPPVYQEAGVVSAGETWRVQTSTQYEISERREVTASLAGGVKEISVGIAVNRTDLRPEQVQQVREMVASAVGAAPERISVTAMPFSTADGPDRPDPAGVPTPAPGTKQALEGDSGLAWLSPDIWAGVLGGLLLLGGVALALRRRSGPTLALPGGMTVDAGLPDVKGAVRDIVARAEQVAPPPPTPESPEVTLQREVESLILDSPEVASGLLRTWLRRQ